MAEDPARMGHLLRAVHELGLQPPRNVTNLVHAAGGAVQAIWAVFYLTQQADTGASEQSHRIMEAQQQASAQTRESRCGPGGDWCLCASTDKCAIWCCLVTPDGVVHPQS